MIINLIQSQQILITYYSIKSSVWKENADFIHAITVVIMTHVTLSLIISTLSKVQTCLTNVGIKPTAFGIGCSRKDAFPERKLTIPLFRHLMKI